MKVMGILNITPDSFYGGCRAAEPMAIEARVREIVDQGGEIIDIGGYSTRPGAAEVSVDEEMQRVLLGMKIVRAVAPEIEVSVDTFRSEVVSEVVGRFGKITVNDISAGDFDGAMIATVAGLGVPYIAMHRRGDHSTMHSEVGYGNIVNEVRDYLAVKREQLVAAGVKEITVDPGFGFSKSVDENYRLLGGLNKIVELGYPVLVGISRKSMIYRVLGSAPEEALTGTAALHWECLRAGAAILRVHDVGAAVEVVRLYSKFISTNSGDDAI